MGRQHVCEGMIRVKQQKTGTEIEIPILPELQRSLDKPPKENMTFLVTEYGAPFTPAGFGNWFRDRVKEAGLSDKCAAHGLRKAAARRLAEAGCTANEIAAITGHASLKEVARYTKKAEQNKFAKAAATRLRRKKRGASVHNPDPNYTPKLE